jgi:Flp pilus assembly pilin Flp
MAMNIVMAAVRRLMAREDGQDLVEYGLLAALIAIAAIIGVSYLGDTLNLVFWRTIAAAV